MAKRTTQKEVKEAIQAHILEHYTREELEDALKAVGRNKSINTYLNAKALVEAGCFLIYYADIQDFLYELLESDKDYDSEKSWELYKHLIAREAGNVLKKKA